MAVHTACETLRAWNQPWQCRKLLSEANSCTEASRRWRRPTFFHLTQNHPFIDGNKRVGANAAIAFLRMNDLDPIFSEDELVELVLGVAQGQVSKEQLTEFFTKYVIAAEG